MRRLMASTLALILTASAASAGQSSLAPPSPMVDPYGGTPHSKREIAQRFSTGNFKVKFNEINISMLAKTIGVGTVQKLPDADVFDYLCYDIPQKQQRVWFAATDSMADAPNVDTVTIVKIEPSAPRAGACPALPSAFQPVAVDGAIRLGMTKAELVKALGQPSKASNGWWVYNSGGAGWRESITVKLDADRVTFLYASNTSTD